MQRLETLGCYGPCQSGGLYKRALKLLSIARRESPRQNHAGIRGGERTGKPAGGSLDFGPRKFVRGGTPQGVQGTCCWLGSRNDEHAHPAWCQISDPTSRESNRSASNAKSHRSGYRDRSPKTITSLARFSVP